MIPIHINNHVPILLVWYINIWSFQSCCLIFHHLTTPIQVCHSPLPNQEIQVILWFEIRTHLSNICDYLYQLLSPHPILLVSLKTTIPWTYFTLISHRNLHFIISKSFSYVIWLPQIRYKNLTTIIQGISSSLISCQDKSNTLYLFHYLSQPCYLFRHG